VRIGSEKSMHYVTAYDKNDVEALGFIKGDFLGLRNLTAVRIACELIEPGCNPIEFLERIPLTDAATYKRIAAGKTAGTFQLSGYSAMEGVRRMKPTKIGDVIAAMALFRPAAQSSGTTAEYLARRKKVSAIPDMHDDLVQETKNTYGLLLYQEQVIGVLRRLRMDMPELNKLLKAVKASNEYVAGAKQAIADALPRIRSLAEKRGWLDSDIAILADAISGYADYGFNEAHAVAYGLLAYRTCWLAEHHPYEWWTGMLTAYANHKLEPMHVRSARAEQVRIVPAHVNRSGVTYRLDKHANAIRKGLLSIRGVGETAAQELAEHAPYKTLVDLGQRVTPRRVSGAKALALKTPPHECGGRIADLYEADALVGLEME
jgi:DNA polymerase III alpha subunit